MSKADIRSKIVQAAIVEYGQNGVGSATLADVASRAKISPPLLKYHYPNTKSLMIEIVNYLVEDLRSEMVAALQKNGTKGYGTIESYALSPLLWAKKYPNKISMWMYFYHLAVFDPTFATINRGVRDIGRDRIALVLYQATEKGDIHLEKGVSMEFISMHIQALITASVIMYATESNADFEKCRQMLLKSLKDICHPRK